VKHKLHQDSATQNCCQNYSSSNVTVTQFTGEKNIFAVATWKNPQSNRIYAPGATNKKKTLPLQLHAIEVRKV